MVKSIDIKKFLEKAKYIPIVDVRSPKEFEKGHIPGAVNIALFSDEERVRIGIKYKQVGRKEAIELGLELAYPKISQYLYRVNELIQSNDKKPDKEVLVYCWRGGMRSENFASLLESQGFKPSTLIKGYKAFRKFVLDSFNHNANIIVLGGMTGSGKTDILNELALLDQQVLDLEKLAQHKGSAFGSIGQNTQPTTEHFENMLFDIWQKFDLTKPVWVEDESHNIGKVHLPSGLWLQMRNSPVIKIEVPKEIRANRLVKEYACFEDNLLEDAIFKIEKRLGGLNTKKALEALSKQDFLTVAQLTLTYYDKAYITGLSKRQSTTIFPLSLDNEDPKENAREVIMFYKKVIL